jgi:hypothetical protein
LPLSEKARVEVYLPELPRPAYQDLLAALEREFTYTFGGCTTIRGVEGHYLSRDGFPIRDRISVVYTDTPFDLKEQFDPVAKYADELHTAAMVALEEEAVLVTVQAVYHAGGNAS